MLPTKELKAIVCCGVLACTMLLPLYNASAQTLLEHDISFNGGDVGNGFGDWFNHPVRCVLELPNGQFLVGGNFDKVHGIEAKRLVRLNPDLSVDGSFNADGPVNGSIRCLAITGTGQILAAGSFTALDGIEAGRLARFNTDGSYDESFDLTVGANGTINSVVAVNGGRSILAGSFTKYQGSVVNRVVKVLEDGSRDESFSVNGGANATVNQIALLADSSLIMVGAFNSVDGQSRNGIAKLDPNGTVNLDFDPQLSSTTELTSIVVLSDGSMVVGGKAGNSQFGNEAGVLYKLDPDGTLNTDFSAQNSLSGSVNHLSVFDDGRLLAVGNFSSWDGADRAGVTVLLANGVSDPTFVATSWNGEELFHGLPLSSGQTLVAGSFFKYDDKPIKHVTKLGSDGTSTSSDLGGTGCNAQARGVLPLNNGGFLIYGDMTGYNGVTIGHVCKVDALGEIDSTFNCGTGANGPVHAALETGNGKLLIAGNFSCFNGNLSSGLVRLNSDGSVDQGFATGEGFDGTVQALVEVDGNVLVSGNFSRYNGSGANGLVALDGNGTVVQGFDVGTGFDGPVLTLISVPDGVLVGGQFSTYKGQEALNLIKLDLAGNAHGQWLGTGTDGPVYSLAQAADEKVMVGGMFMNVNGVEQRHLVSINPDGTTNNQYTTGTWPDNVVRTILPIPGGQGFVIGGDFWQYNGQPSNYLAMIDLSGNLINGVHENAYPNRPVNRLTANSEGQVLMAGDFTKVGEVGRNRVARLSGLLTQTFGDQIDATLSLFPNPCSDGFRIDGLSNEVEASLFDASGKLVGSFVSHPNEYHLVTDIPSGTYTISVTDGSKVKATDLVIIR